MSAEDRVIVLRRRDVASLLDLPSCIVAVEQMFRARGEGRTQPPEVLSLHVENGTFHVKAGVLERERAYFAAKVNGNFPSNPARLGLPTIQGVLVLADARSGRPLAIMDSIEITAQRTAAATAVAARHLARADSSVVTIVGCGIQARAHLSALRAVLPISQVFAADRDGCRRDRFADECAAPGIEIHAEPDLPAALDQSDIVVTCTPSRDPLLHAIAIAPGTFVAAVGADNPEKSEIHPDLMAASRVVVDDLGQCASFGDLHHAIEAGTMTREDVHAELAEVVAGRKPGRTREDQITLFDSTGIALQDVAAAAVVYERALAQGAGLALVFAE
ncbi:MAG TPA: ornithine cyclodeaminase family protein [Myxococcales bacterium]|nr:ornithine cyclodeaminase family protein [Myxococcales bacterium]